MNNLPRDSKGRFIKGIGYRTGSKVSKESKLKMSLAKKRRKDIKEWMNKIRPDITGDKNKNWKGGISILSNGYRYIAKSLIEKDIYELFFKKTYGSRKIPEHQYIWVKFYRQQIGKGFRIHHINGIQIDNRIENLERVSESKHRKIHYKLDKQI